MAKHRFLSKAWNANHLKQIRYKAGPRYTPELNVSLPISEIFESISKTPEFYNKIRTNLGDLMRLSFQISTEYNTKEMIAETQKYELQKEKLISLISTIKEYNTLDIPWKEISDEAANTSDIIWSLLDKLREEKIVINKREIPETEKNKYPTPSDEIEMNIRHVYDTHKTLKYFNEFSMGKSAKLSNIPFLLINGSAGSGKTHLLCDLIENRLKAKTPFPSILLFGEFFNNNDDFWKQVAKQLGLNKYYYRKENLLTSLNNAGKKAKCRTLFIIDALNETRPSEIWKENLKDLLNELRRFPNLGLIVSVRNGFKEDVIGSEIEEQFIQIEHEGFSFREWEAITKFFKAFSLPLPEIPLLLSEFQNPLFLLLFCKAFSNRSKQVKNSKKREVFRGHEGATFIFENFVKETANKIAKEFNVPKGRINGRSFIWDTVIERLAQKMVEENNDRIAEELVITIIRESHPKINPDELLKALEKNLLLIKVPRYSSDYHQKIGFSYRFPFQKFSDHLIGRYIFKKCFASGKKPIQFFEKNTDIGKFIAKRWNRGLIEALAIQCPEMYNGLEFFEVAPYLESSYLQEATIESLIWRKVDAFASGNKKLLDYLNNYQANGGDRHILNTFLSVAPIPGHPFNAFFLHKNLIRLSMPVRDSCWGTFLHWEYGEHNSVDRLIEWGWSNQDKSNVKDEAILLCSIPLVWFLSSSNCFLRDKATKALVNLLSSKLSIILQLLEHFKSVDDLYIIDRLYAVIYGCIMRNKKDIEGGTNIALWLINNFYHKNPIPHILVRDYSRGIMEIAKSRNLIDIPNLNLVPPFGSKFPTKIPSRESLEKKFNLKDSENKRSMEYFSIWSSVMNSGDFGRYEISSALGHWTGRRLNKKNVDRRLIFEKFKIELTRKQRNLFNKLTPSFKDYMKIKVVYITDENREEYERKESKEKLRKLAKLTIFKLSISSEQRINYEKNIEPFLDESFKIRDPLDNFDTELGQRWIFNRVIQLGWSPELHGEFDKNVNRRHTGRSEKKAERIGKKYQWIAFYEFLAIVSDHFEFKEDSFHENIIKYEGPWQLDIRDIDASCILKDTTKAKKNNFPKFREFYDLNWAKQPAFNDWLQSKIKLPNPKSLLELTDSTGNKWLLLNSYFTWKESTPPEVKEYDVLGRNIWYSFNSYIVEQKDHNKLFKWAKKQDFFGEWMPKSNRFYQIFLGEYPYLRPFSYYENQRSLSIDTFAVGRKGQKPPTQIIVTDEEYSSTASSADCSIENAITIQLPAKVIIDGMNLVHKDFDGCFYDSTDTLIAFDPSIFYEKMPGCLLIRKDSFLYFLETNNYSVLWTLIGDKSIMGGHGRSPQGGYKNINGAYTLNESNKIIGTKVIANRD